MPELYRVVGDGKTYYATRSEAETRFLERSLDEKSGLQGDLVEGFSYPLRDRMTGIVIGTVRVLPSSFDELEADANDNLRPRPGG